MHVDWREYTKLKNKIGSQILVHTNKISGAIYKEINETVLK
jgi:hypothetical protein